MSSKHFETQFDWPAGGSAWEALYRHIRAEMSRKRLVSVRGEACMVTATFTMSPGSEHYHTQAPGLTTLTENLIGTLEEAGVLDGEAVTQINIGKVRPGPNAVRTTPGIRVSIMVLGVGLRVTRAPGEPGTFPGPGLTREGHT